MGQVERDIASMKTVEWYLEQASVDMREPSEAGSALRSILTLDGVETARVVLASLRSSMEMIVLLKHLLDAKGITNDRS